MHYFDSIQLNACIYHAILYWHASVTGDTFRRSLHASQRLYPGYWSSAKYLFSPILFCRYDFAQIIQHEIDGLENWAYNANRQHFTMLHSPCRNFREKSVAKSNHTTHGQCYPLKFRPGTRILWPFYDFIIHGFIIL